MKELQSLRKKSGISAQNVDEPLFLEQDKIGPFLWWWWYTDNKPAKKQVVLFNVILAPSPLAFVNTHVFHSSDYCIYLTQVNM